MTNLRATYFRTSYAYLLGNVVTEGHAEACRTYGHAVNIRDGKADLFCPRCGDVTLRKSSDFLA